MPVTRHSVCALDCPDACSLLINVDEAGHGTRLRGNPEHPVTRGFLCAKVAKYLDREYNPARLLHPLKRTGPKGSGQFERIGWDEAFDEITQRLQSVIASHGPESILPYSYAGTMGLLNFGGMDRRFFHQLGASRLDRTICSAAGMAGLTEALGVRYAPEPESFRHSKLIVAWGANILATNVHLWPFIVEARRNGARFYVIDPHRNKTAQLADRHFAIHPGSDAALALGMMHVIIRDGLEDKDYIAKHTQGFDELRARVAQYTPRCVAKWTGIPETDIEELAREYATTRPAAIRLNYGVQRSERGGMAVRSIGLLPALTGSWKDLGGGLQLSTSQAFHLDRNSLERPDLHPKVEQAVSPAVLNPRIINMSQLGSVLNDLNDPPVQALVVYNSNPAAIAPDQNAVLKGLRRPDLFTVVLEQFLTPTAAHADIVLPSTTFLEHTDLYTAYGHFYIQLARPALPAPGECRSNWAIFRELASRMGLTDPCFRQSEDDAIRALLASGHPHLNGITLERLEEEHFVRLNISPEGTPFLPFAEGNFGTPSGKCEFRAETLGYVPPVESRMGEADLLSEYPLELISPKNHDSMNSTFGNRSDVDSQTAVATIHPQDAASRGISTGDPVRLFNRRGHCDLIANVEAAIPAGVVCVPSSRWGQNVNALASERLTDLGGGPTFSSCLVNIAKLEIS
jgi:anaerobic selenocysteine-containing dehydrogenase